MTGLSGHFYDGQTSERRAVTVKLTVPGYLVVQDLGSLSRYRLEDVDIPEQLGSQPARIGLPDGAMLEIADSAGFFGQLQLSSGRNQWLHRLESSWSWALIAIGVTVLAGWLAYVWAIPEMARQVAYAMPVEIDQAIGEEGLGILDDQLFAPSELDVMRQLQITAAFMSVVETVGEGDDYRYQLVFRKGEAAGANAFALPAGTIVITDEMVALAEHDDEIAAILAHEVGHIRNRHSLRALLQNSAVAVLVITLTGDVSSATSLAAGIPTVLAQAGYSREFEYEADEVAREYLLAAGIPLHRFADIILRMDDADDRPGVLNLLATHPESRDRAQTFRDEIVVPADSP